MKNSGAGFFYHIFYHIFYRWFIYPILMISFRLLAFSNPKIKMALAMRAKKNNQWPWLMTAPTTRPIWFHCASGEFEYAKPVIQALKLRRPELKILLTYFSPSAIEMVQKFKLIDFSTPLPWDQPQILEDFLKFHQPRALLISRTDAWPEMLVQTKRAKIPSLMFAATLADKSSRMRFFSKGFSSWVLGLLNEIQCVSREDFQNFKSLGLEGITKIAGDTRYDQVLARLKNPKAFKNHLFVNSQDILVAGSTWPEDEEVLFKLHLKNPQIKLCIVPHEPTTAHLESLQGLAKAQGMKTQFYSQSENWDEGQILIVDQVGILAELYTQAQFAFVGGSFKKTVHSVMEPLAAGCLTFVGPKHHNNREALAIKNEKLKSLNGDAAVIEVSTEDEWSQKLNTLSKNDLNFDQVKLEIKALITTRSGHALAKALDWLEAQLK